MAYPRLDRARIKELHEQGLKVSEIAKDLGCTPAGVYKQLKRLGVDIASAACPVAPAWVEKQDAAAKHLMYLIGTARKELDWIEAEVPVATSAEYRLWQDQKIKFAAEMRKLISAIADIGYKLFQANEVSEALRIIEEEIALESLECQQRIRGRLERRRHIRFPVGVD